MEYRDRQQALAGIEALERVLTNPSKHGSTEDNVVSILSNAHNAQDGTWKYRGTGILITTCGYVLTAYHCIEAFVRSGTRRNIEVTLANFHTQQDRNSFYLQTAKGLKFPLDPRPGTMTISKKYDLALVRAFTGGDSLGTGIRLAEGDATLNERVTVLAPRQGGIQNLDSCVVDCSRTMTPSSLDPIEDLLIHDAQIVLGDSGSPVIREGDEIVGIVSISGQTGQYRFAGSAKVSHIRQLLEFACTEYRRRLTGRPERVAQPEIPMTQRKRFWKFWQR